MFKKIRIPVLAAMLLLSTASAKAQGKLDKWPALKDFHTVMSATFHPAEEGNLEPVKTRSKEMRDKAVVLLASPVPAEFNKPGVKEAVKELAKGARALHKNIAGKKLDDGGIKARLTALHEVFHKIVEKCMKGTE